MSLFLFPPREFTTVVLWYAITDAGAGFEALGKVAGKVAITFHGRIVQQDTLPRRGTMSELFTDTNGLILTRFKAESAGNYILRLNVTAVPPHLDIYGAGVRVLKLAETSSDRASVEKRPNYAILPMTGSPGSSSSMKLHLQPAATSLSPAVAHLVLARLLHI
jgi:hypothetical protein